MKVETLVTKCSKLRWEKAQLWEKRLWASSPKDGDDWNLWWANKFDDYSFIHRAESIIEVGCGPYARNTRYVIEKRGLTPSFVTLSDPLLSDYIAENKSVCEVIKKYSAEVVSEPLENLSSENKYDIVICINVLDHVFDAGKCVETCINLLSNGGVLIIGQDLTNGEDAKMCPETMADIGHPIKVTDDWVRGAIGNVLTPVFDKVLPRREGRNPKAHFGTLLYAGKKLDVRPETPTLAP